MWGLVLGAGFAVSTCVFDSVALDSHQTEVLRAVYTTQLTPEGPFDAPNFSGFCDRDLNPRPLAWVEPAAGVTEDTGLLLCLYGIGRNCDDEPPFRIPDESWPDAKDLVVAHVSYRNIEFFPGDMGKYQMVDVLRALGVLLEEYPQLEIGRAHV